MKPGVLRTLQRALKYTIALSIAGLLQAGCATVTTTAEARLPSATIAYALLGDSGPSVVLQAGLGDGKSVWSRIAGDLSRDHRVLAFDRPGYGDSPARTNTRDPCTIAAEQHELLAHSGLRPPYILVGHSLGGLYQFVYAKRYPEQVAALVLVDATHPAHWGRMQSEAPAVATMLKGMRNTVFGPTMRQEFDAQETCLDSLDLTQPLRVPVRLLVRSEFGVLEQGAFERLVHTLERDWQALSGAVQVERVNGSRHYIQKERPAAVLAAVRDLSLPAGETP